MGPRQEPVGKSYSRNIFDTRISCAHILLGCTTSDAALAQTWSLYSTLCTPQTFRLLQILPARNDGDPIRCILRDVDRELAPSLVYRALSYMWGVLSDRMPIFVNGHTMYITWNLYDAMLHLRVTHSHTNLWIDALCINQQDLNERKHQVKQMKTIYGEAREVICWLGLQHEYIKCLFFSIEQHLEDHHDKCELSQCLFRSQEPLLAAYQVFHTRLMNALRYLEDSPYWRRVWIVQEVVTARRVVLLSGNNTLMWPALVKFRDLVAKTLEQFSQRQATSGIMQSLASWPRESVGLAQALYYSKDSLATDRRDKVYAILGLVNRGAGQDLIADYTLAPCTVFCLAVRAMLADWNQDLYDRKTFDSLTHLLLARAFRTSVQPINMDCVKVSSRYLIQDTAESQEKHGVLL